MWRQVGHSIMSQRLLVVLSSKSTVTPQYVSTWPIILLITAIIHRLTVLEVPCSLPAGDDRTNRGFS